MGEEVIAPRTGYCQDENHGEGTNLRGLALTIESLGNGDSVRIALRGELDLEHAYTFDEELKRVEALDPECICIDLRELAFLDSCGLARLVAARRRARKSGRRLVLVRGSRAVQRLFQLTAVDEAFEIVNGPEALAT
jgi:anti-sigma B factor antagonist